MFQKLTLLFTRYAGGPVSGALISNAHIAESIILLDGFSSVLIFFLLMNIVVFFVKKKYHSNHSKSGLKTKFLLISEVIISSFSLITIIISFFQAHVKTPHDIHFYWLVAANVIVFVVIEMMNYLHYLNDNDASISKGGKKRNGYEKKNIKNLSHYNKTTSKSPKTTRLSRKKTNPGNLGSHETSSA